jgi:hypothetical protein
MPHSAKDVRTLHSAKSAGEGGAAETAAVDPAGARKGTAAARAARRNRSSLGKVSGQLGVSGAMGRIENGGPPRCCCLCPNATQLRDYATSPTAQDGRYRFRYNDGARRPRDRFFAALFVLYWVGMAYVAQFGLATGNTARLLYATDHSGAVCGTGAMADRPVIYYPSLAADFSWKGVCLARCPAKGDEVEMLGSTYTVQFRQLTLFYRCVDDHDAFELTIGQCTGFAPQTAPPTLLPTPSPTQAPTSSPTPDPTQAPSLSPTPDPNPPPGPTPPPSAEPTPAPSGTPTQTPTAAPTVDPTLQPTANPTAVDVAPRAQAGLLRLRLDGNASLPALQLRQAEADLLAQIAHGNGSLTPFAAAAFVRRVFQLGFLSGFETGYANASASAMVDPAPGPNRRLRIAASAVHVARVASAARALSAPSATAAVVLTECAEYARQYGAAGRACDAHGAFAAVSCSKPRGELGLATVSAEERRASCELQVRAAYPGCCEVAHGTVTVSTRPLQLHPLYRQLRSGGVVLARTLAQAQALLGVALLMGVVLPMALSGCLVLLLTCCHSWLLKLALRGLGLAVWLLFVVVTFLLLGTAASSDAATAGDESAGMQQRMRSFALASAAALNSDVAAAVSGELYSQPYYIAAATASCVCTFLVSVLLLVFWRTVADALLIMKYTAMVVRDTGMAVVLLPFVQASLYAMLVVFWVGVSCLVCSSDQLGAVGVQAGAGALDMHSRSIAAWLLGFLALGVLWTMNVLRAVEHCALAGVVSNWFWSGHWARSYEPAASGAVPSRGRASLQIKVEGEGEAQGGETAAAGDSAAAASVGEGGQEGQMAADDLLGGLGGSLLRTVCVHFGSLAFGALTLGVIDAVVVALRFHTALARRALSDKAKGSGKRSWVAGLQRCTSRCFLCLSFTRGLIDLSVCNGYVAIAMVGSGLCTSMKFAKNLVLRHKVLYLRMTVAAHALSMVACVIVTAVAGLAMHALVSGCRLEAGRSEAEAAAAAAAAAALANATGLAGANGAGASAAAWAAEAAREGALAGLLGRRTVQLLANCDAVVFGLLVAVSAFYVSCLAWSVLHVSTAALFFSYAADKLVNPDWRVAVRVELRKNFGIHPMNDTVDRAVLLWQLCHNPNKADNHLGVEELCRLFDAADTNKDGQISREEFKGVLTRLFNQQVERDPGHPHGQHLQPFGTAATLVCDAFFGVKDRVLDLAKGQKAGTAAGERVLDGALSESKQSTLFRLVDKDNNNMLSREEFNHYMKVQYNPTREARPPPLPPPPLQQTLTSNVSFARWNWDCALHCRHCMPSGRHSTASRIYPALLATPSTGGWKRRRKRVMCCTTGTAS